MARRTLPWLATMTLILLSGNAQSASLEKLLMPGDLAEVHAGLEDDCGSCHDRTDKSKQRAQCLACHDHAGVAADIASGQGFHGRAARRAQCNACHTEHKGRGADIVNFDAAGFDHKRADFQLSGAHVGVACGDCHEQGKKFREAPGQCFDCHRGDDSHTGRLGTDCGQCHEPVSFKQVKFDHDTTRFPLRDAHGSVACAACHRDPGFKDTPTTCYACHAADDVHRGTRGTDCSACHGAVDWKQSRFDHARQAGYPLEGKHAQLACGTCHRGGDLKAELPRECSGCHATNDRHSGRFGAACGDCHGQQEWPIEKWDHDTLTEFPLRGAHQEVDCHACHTGVIKQQELPKDCFGCHASDDVHAGSMGHDCQSCHKETGWRDEVRFDHDFASFPLVGLHVSVPCEECHATRAYREAPVECVACHRAKDAHEGSLGDQCASCHNANGWAFWQFDHGKATEFGLTGRHAELGCRDCHVEGESKSALPRDCWSCHYRDDVHDSRFGRDCGRCHGTDSFRQAAGR
jgi:hypothetical protein